MSFWKCCCFLASYVLFAAVIPAQHARGDEPDPGKVAVVLGPNAARDWTFGASATTVTTEGSETFLWAPAGFVMEGNAVHEAPTEYLFTYRLAPGPGTASASFSMALSARTDKTPCGVTCSMSAAAGVNYVQYQTTVIGSKAPPAAGALHLVPVTERSLAWPEDLRRVIEVQMAAARTPSETLFSGRVTIADGKVRTWVNGRYVSEVPLEPGTTGNGTMRVQFSAGAKLISMRVRPLAVLSARFEPISIAGHVNASALGKTKVDHSSLSGTTSDTVAGINGVPFEFPAANVKGDDHLDVGQSWTRFGRLSGAFFPNSGQFGGRWVAADRMDPARLCFYLPKGRYKALHLIAVADSEDNRDDSVPVVSAQFYRPDAGHPITFSANVPDDNGKGGEGKAVPIKLADGRSGKLYHVKIPLEPDAFSWFTDLDRIGLEITKQVHYYRTYPDPHDYSHHGGGLPSSVQIYAMTLERADTDVEITPENYGHIWTAPALPHYSLRLTNAGGKTAQAKVTITTASNDGLDKTKQSQNMELAGNGGSATIPVSLKPTRYGLHEMTITVELGDETSTFKRNFAFLHPDTRERGHWEEGRGSIFGYWPWGGGHDTPLTDKEIPVMAAAGAEASVKSYSHSPPEIQALARKHYYISEAAFTGGVYYYTGFYQWYQGAPKWDPTKPEETAKGLIDVMRKMKAEPSDLSRPSYVGFFAEPHIGTITTGIWPTHYGEPDYKLKPEEQEQFAEMRAKYMLGAAAIRKEWPDLKLLLPYGDPMNAVVFTKLAPESRPLIDGTALDLPGFERMPEQQINQVVLNRLYPILKDIKQYNPNPYLVLIEGFCVGSKDIDTNQEGQAEIGMRSFLVLMGYGVTRFESNNAPFDCANFWGENHYGVGWMSRLPVAQPKLAYVHYATLTRNLNRASFSKYVPTGSLSTFCQQFKHYKTGDLVHVLWTIRGTRPVSVAVPAGATLELYDGNDNVTKLHEKNGVVKFEVNQMPVYLKGLTADAQVTLGESDHSDSKPGESSKKIANLGNGSWKVVAKADEEYTTNKSLQIERFLGRMTGTPADAPKEQGNRALAVHLGTQDTDRGVMPFYTTVEPSAPVEIKGKASHLGLWVRAASDWGRVVYFVRDAKGEKWISVGTKDDWNCDDIHAWSSFSFDGWRYLKFPLPSSLPYDSYREHGTTWWGSYGGDGVVDLPLKLEKIIVERRPKAIYGAQLLDTKPDDVLLGDLYAEYAPRQVSDDEAIRLSRLRMPMPKEAPALSNPIADLAAAGVGDPPKGLRVTDPDFQYNGTRCHVHFEPVAGAKAYDVWVSPYPDGRGALHLGNGWIEPGQLITGLRPDIEFYLFVTCTRADDKISKPSAPLPFTLKDRFGYE